MAKRLRKKSIAEEMRDRATGNNQTYTVEERKDTVIPKQDMTPTPTLQDRINKHYVENMQNLANTTMNMVTNTVKRNPIVNSFMAGFNTGKNVELPQNQVKTIQNAVKKDLQTNTQDKRNPLMAIKNQNEQKKEEEEKHKENVSYKPYQLPQAQEMVNKNQQEVDERKKNEEAQGLLSQVQNRTLPQAQKQEEVKKPTLKESIEEYLRTGDIRKSTGNYFKSQFEGGKQGVLEYGQYYNETLPSKVEGDSWTKRKSEEQYKAKEYREGLLNDVKQNPNNYSKEQKSFIKNQQEFTEKYGDNFYEAYKNESKEKVNKMIEEAPTEIDRKLIEIGQSNGQSTVGAGFSMLSPIAGTMYFYGSSAQSYYDSALEMGMAESDAWKYANVMGAWETVSEELITANRVDQVSKILTGSNIGKTGMKFLGNSMVENAFQEALSEPVDDITKSMLNYSYLNEGQLGERMLESGVIGAISALLMDSPTAVLSAPGDIVNLYNKSVEKIGKKATIEKMQKGAETYYAQILSEINNGLGNDAYEMMRNQNIQEENELSRLLPGQYENQQEIDRTRDEKLKAITEDMTEGDKTAYLIQNSNLSQEEKDSLSRVARRLNVSAEQIDDLLKFNEEQKQIQSENNELEQMIDNSNLSQAQIGEVLSQKSFEEAKNKINELNEENNANQEAIKTLGLNISEENKEGNISYKEKQNIEISDSDTLESSYKKYFGENETTFVKRLKNLDKAAIESGQNVKLVFDGNYFKDDNGNILTGVEAAFVTKDGKRIIAVNPYATTGKAFEQVLAHELTHAVLSEENADTQALYKSVQDYLTSKGEYDNIVKDLKGLYGKNYNEEEVVAKTIERLFNSKEELNSLANSNPNIFTRIYRSLVGMYAKLTGSEKAYLKKMKLDMELAWKNSNNKGSLQDTIKNSITETSTTDSQGRKLTKEQQEYFKDSKARDLRNGGLVNVFHTTTGTTPQFNEFNPVGTSGYKFGNQVVNYYTDDKEMSGSYANQKYKMANTQKLQSMNDVDNFIDSINSNSKSGNEYFISENDGKYTLILTDSEIGGNVAEFFENLSEEEKQELSDNIYHDTDFAGTPYEFTFSWDKFSKELQKKYNALMDKYVGDEKLIDAEKRLYELATGQQANNEIATYDSQEELFKHLQEDLQKNNWTDNTKIQYSGYVNIQNPYVIDAEGRNWDSVEVKPDQKMQEKLSSLTEEQKENLKNEYNKIVEEGANAKILYNSFNDMVYDLQREGSNNNIFTVLRYFEALDSDDFEVADNILNNLQETLSLSRNEVTNMIYRQEFTDSEKQVVKQYEKIFKDRADKDISDVKTFYELYKTLDYEKIHSDFNSKFLNKYSFDSYARKLLPRDFFKDNVITSSVLEDLVKNDFDEKYINRVYGERSKTNDIVKQVIDYNNSLFNDTNDAELAEQYGMEKVSSKNRTPEEILAMGGYDGVIIRNTTDYGGRAKNIAPHDLYITFGSEQFKAKDNKNPTLDKDIRYSEQIETADEILDRLLEKYRGKGERTYLPGIPKNLPKDYIMELGNKIEQMSIPDDKKLELYNLANTNDWNEESYNNFMTDLDGIEQDFKNQQQRDRFTTKSYDNPDRAKLITRKHNEFNKDYHYNDKLVDEIDSLLPRNRNGKRTVKDWKQFARELGKRLALDNYTPDEIEDIAVKSYYDLQPSKNITKYDNKAKKSVGFERLYANDWVNSVYEGLNEAGYDATKYSITDNGQNNEQPVLPQKELSNKLPVGQVNESKEDSLNAIREHHERELGDTINLEDIQNLPDLKGDKLEGDLPKTIDRIVDKRTKEKVTVKEFIKELKKQFVNKAYAVDKLAKQTGNKKLTHKYDRQLMAFNEAQVSLGDAQVNKDGRVVGKSLIETFKKAKDTGLDRVFADYLENRNNIARDKLGESLYGADVTAVQSRKIVEEYEKKYPQFKEWANDVSKYNDNLAESYLVGSFINQELWNKLKQLNPDYVPAFRDIVETKGLSDSVDNVGFQVLKRAEGGSSKILTPKEAMAEQTVNYVKAYRKNETIKELYKTIKGKLDSTDILYEDMETVPEIAYEMMREAVGKDQDGHYTATFFENGKATTFKVGKDIFDAFVQGKGIEAIEKNAITKVLGGTTRNIAQFQRNAVTTYSIPFLLKNMVRDYNDALINTQYSDLRFMKNYARAYIEMITKGKYYEQYKNAGGGANTYYDYEKGLLPGSTKNPLKKSINKVVSLNEYIETAPRLAEFISTMEKGGNLDEALYNAAEITTNFKRGGDTAKLINKYGANFFNASIQGADKVIRNITGQKGLKGYANLAVKTMIAGVAPSLLNHILISGSDDPEERKAYEELQDYIKNNYYLIYKGNGDFYRIPKGRIAGTIGAAAVGLYRTTQGEDDAFDGYFKNVLLENLAPNNPLTNNIIAPVLQAKKNDAWYDGTIYSETKYANKLPMEVTDEKVDDFSNLVAKGVNALFDDETLMKSKTNNGWLDILANPKKLNYVLDQYSGGFGDIVLPQLTPRAENNFIADQFTTSSVLKNKYVGEFYDMCDNNIGNSEYATDFDKLTYKYLEGKSKEVGGLYKEKHEIEQSDLPDEEKMKQSREKQKEINELCKEAVETVKGTKVTGNTAEFGGQTYYKDNEDEWKKVSEDSEMNMLYTVDATTYADWKNKTTAANKAKKESEGKGLTDKEKDAMLVNSTYRDEEKEAIYMDSMGKDDDVYKALKIIAQPDIDEYLTYQSQTFESDRVDDGTAKGKAVTKGEGTSKNKTINYLDNSNMSSAETEYIKATKYKLDSTAALREYIDSLNLSEEDYRTVMSNIKDSNVVELSDGTWKWK